jgi:hypothetical protein
LIIRDGKALTLGSNASNPVALARHGKDCCCNNEVLGCSTCEHFENELFDSAHFDCDRLAWIFDDEFNCELPNDQTQCCRTFLPTPFAHVQLQSELGDYFFPNSCFSMRVFMEPYFKQSTLVLTCCIGVKGVRFNESEGTAETMTINVIGSGLYEEAFFVFENIPCDRIIDNRGSGGRGDARDGGYRIHTNITQWEDVVKISPFGSMECAESGSFGRSCRIRPADGTVIAKRDESGIAPNVGLTPSYNWLWTQFLDSSTYLDSSFKTQFKIEPEGVIDIDAEHSVEPC